MTKISVITRTKNRSLFLSRCMESLLRQTYRDFTWVIVNDNGNIGEVEEISAAARLRGLSTILIHRSQNVGIAAAANNGILESNSEFIHLHDDDDTLEPTFYQEVISFFESNPHYKGVVTSTNRVDEKVDGGAITIVGKSKIFDFDGTIYSADLIWKNQFAPISFVYRRNVIESIGLYDESLPVLEDWDFNLRFTQRFDIGVISRFLANYHWRAGSNTGGMTQTVVSGAGLHRDYTAVIRNKMLRQDLLDGRFGLGSLMTLGRFHQLQSNSFKLIESKINSQQLLRRIMRRIISLIYIR